MACNGGGFLGAIPVFCLNGVKETIVFSFDINYEKEELLNIIKKDNNIVSTPYIIFENKTTRDVLHDDELVVSLNTITVEYKKFKGEIE
jgi:hypothetical protein